MTLSGLLPALRAMRRRNGWHRYGEAAGDTPGVFTCCDHCPRDCNWASHHPAPCKQCIREMELVSPLPGDVTDVDGRCITCAALHGVRITHGRTW
jgi:hypothetical protein